MKLTVQKFGGTSVANLENRNKVVDKIMSRLKEGYKIVVVVSAIGRKGDPYATDTLLSLIDTDICEKREIDLLLSCGEIISSVILSNMLSEKGILNSVLTGLQAGIVTDTNYGNANILSVNPQKIVRLLEDKNVVIIPGFQGGTEDSEITTLGRGGSDTTAVVIGEALNCDYVEIYTDVDGVMTADPRIVPEASVINKISYDELFQLAEDGAKVIHPRAVEIAQRSNIIIKIKNTLNSSDGTIVTRKENRKFNDNYYMDKTVSSITYKNDRSQIIIEEICSNTPINIIMQKISINKISIDLINFSLDKKVFTVQYKDVNNLIKILDSSNCKYKIIDNCCKLSLVGNKIKGTPGVMYKIIDCLYKKNIDVLQTSDSHTTIWCLIFEKDLDEALKVLHKEFNLGKK